MTQQFLEQNAITMAPHPICSPDLALLDFDIFGYVKQLLAGQEFPDKKAFLGRINEMLREIEKVILERVFLEWMGKIRRYIDTSGEQVD
jgi:hypothetical protein